MAVHYGIKCLEKKYLRKYEDSVENKAVGKVIEKKAERGIHCLTCTYIDGIIMMLP